MNFEEFERLIIFIQNETNLIDLFYSFGFDLDPISFDKVSFLVNSILINNFGEFSISWINWFVFSKLPNNKFNIAVDNNNNEICFDIKSLYDFLNTKKDLVFKKEKINFIS